MGWRYDMRLRLAEISGKLNSPDVTGEERRRLIDERDRINAELDAYSREFAQVLRGDRYYSGS